MLAGVQLVVFEYKFIVGNGYYSCKQQFTIVENSLENECL